MINLVWIIIILAVICIGLLILRGVKGPAHTLESISKPIEDLLVRGYDDGFLIIDASGTNYFIQLRKYIITSDNYGIELSFPKADWSKNFFIQLIDYCDRSGIKYSLSKEDSMKNALEFLHIDFGKDVNKAHGLIKKIITEIFGLSKSTKLFVRLENASLK